MREFEREGEEGQINEREKVIIEERGHSEKERGRVKGEEDKSRIRGGKWKIKGTRQYSYILFFFAPNQTENKRRKRCAMQRKRNKAE